MRYHHCQMIADFIYCLLRFLAVAVISLCCCISAAELPFLIVFFGRLLIFTFYVRHHSLR